MTLTEAPARPDGAEPDAADPPRSRWGIILLAVAGGVVIAFQMGKVPATVPTLQRDLGLSLVDAGLVISLIYGFAAIFGLAAGAVAERLGIRRVAVAGLGCAALGSLGGGFADGLWPLLASRLLEGIGAVAMLITAPVLVLRAVAPKDLRLAMGIWGAFMPTGIATMLLLTPVLLDAVGWRGMWFVNAGLVAGFAVWLWVGTRPVAGASGPTRSGGSVLRLAGEVLVRPGPPLLAAIFGAYAFTFLCVSAFLPKYLVDARGWDEASAAVITALVIAANAVGNLVGGWLGHRGLPRWLLIATGIGTMGLTSWLIYQPWVGNGLAVTLAFAFSGVGGLLPASIFASAPLHAPAPGRVAGVQGLILQATNIGQLTGPPIFAAIVAASTWSQGPWLTLGMAGVGVLLAARLGRLEARL